MSKIVGIIAKLRQLTPVAIENVVLTSFKENEAEVLDMNIAQLQEGKNSQGKKITPAYTKRTKEIKKFKGQPTDRVTLKDEGDFYRGFYLETDSFPIFFRSRDWKEPKLVDKYGEQIFGLGKPNKKQFAKTIIEKIRERVLSALRV